MPNSRPACSIAIDAARQTSNVVRSPADLPCPPRLKSMRTPATRVVADLHGGACDGSPVGEPNSGNAGNTSRNGTASTESVKNRGRVKHRGLVGSILPFLKPRNGSFDDQATRVMGEAFDAARKKAHGAEQIVCDAIAARIIAAANRGERDPTRLRDAGLVGLGYDNGTG